MRKEHDIFKAIKAENDLGVRRIIKNHPNELERKDENGNTPLNHAYLLFLEEKNKAIPKNSRAYAEFTRNRRLHSYKYISNAIIASLSKHHMQGLTATNNRKQTPLILAAQCGHTLPLPPALLKHAVNSKDDRGFSALSYALQIQNKNAAKVLLERGAEVTARLDLSNLLKLFHDTQKHPEFNQTAINDIMLGLIHNKDEDSIFLETILKHAKENDAIQDSLKHLVEGRTAIEHAIERNKMDAVVLLLQHASELNQQYQIFNAIHRNDVPTMSNLINDTNIAELSPFIIHYAARYEHQKLSTLVTALLKTQNQATAASAKKDSQKILQRFIHQKDDNDQSALIFSTILGDIDNVKTLLDYGANVNLQTRKGLSALMIACEKGNIPLVKMLLVYGANVNLQTQRGRSALMIACEQGNNALVKMLLDNDANVNLIDSFNQSCLERVIVGRRWDEELLQLCVENPGCSEYRKKRAIISALQNVNLSALTLLFMAVEKIEYTTVIESQIGKSRLREMVRMNTLEALIHIIQPRTTFMSSLYPNAVTNRALAYTALYELLIRTDKDVLQNLITTFYRHYTTDCQLRPPPLQNHHARSRHITIQDPWFITPDYLVLVQCFFNKTDVLQTLENKDLYISSLSEMGKASQFILLVNITKYCPKSIQPTLIKIAAFLSLSLTAKKNPLQTILCELLSDLAGYCYDQRTHMIDSKSMKSALFELTSKYLRQSSETSACDNLKRVSKMIKELNQDIWSLGQGADLIDDKQHTYIEMAEMKSSHYRRDL